jgi:DNA-binding CsgD family transcriptional regulator
VPAAASPAKAAIEGFCGRVHVGIPSLGGLPAARARASLSRVPTLAPTTANGRDSLIERAQGADSINGLFEAASERLHRLLPFDAAVWFAADPATMLPAAPSRAENMEHRVRRLTREQCLEFWEREFLEEDVNLYRDLSEAKIPAAGLRLATGDRPDRSGRFRELFRQKGFSDELRLVMRVDGSPWAMASLFREEGRDAFTADEVELVAGISNPVGEAVRAHARPLAGLDDRAANRGPGLMVLAEDGELLTANDDALAWLEELPMDSWEWNLCNEGRPFQKRLPFVVMSTLMRARTAAERGEHGSSRARMRSVTGQWLVCHASCLRDVEGSPGDTALVIEQAKASEIAPIIVEAYGLSEREQEITKLIARGVATAEIAERLFLSVHTVRDYIKVVFEKVGVSSRGELVAKLFAEHYVGVHAEPEHSEWADVGGSGS